MDIGAKTLILVSRSGKTPAGDEKLQQMFQAVSGKPKKPLGTGRWKTSAIGSAYFIVSSLGGRTSKSHDKGPVLAVIQLLEL